MGTTKLTPKIKRQLLADLIELYVFCGYSIEDMLGRELSYFDFDKIQANIIKMKAEKDVINGIKYGSKN